MDKKMLKALKASIAHWGRLATGNQKADESIGPYHCALCRACGFVSDVGEVDCDPCPVAERTGRWSCRGTPYREAEEAMTPDHSIDSPQFRAAALKEYDFLKSLLPKESSNG